MHLRTFSASLCLMIGGCTGNDEVMPTSAEQNLEVRAGEPSFAYAAVNSCSGALFRLEGMTEGARALVITNGHCVALDRLTGAASAYPAPGQVVTNLEGPAVSNGSFVILQGAAGSYQAHVTKLAFATMTGTDIGIFELSETYDELRTARHLAPITLEPEVVSDVANITIVSGLYNRRFPCALDGRVSLREGPYTTTDGVRFTSACRIYNGVSGSPIVSTEGRFVGLANTHYAGSGAPCSLSNPCEVNPTTGAVSVGAVDQSYGVVAGALYACFDRSAERLDFLRPACPWHPTT